MKHKYISFETQVRFVWNTSTFRLKRKGVFEKAKKRGNVIGLAGLADVFITLYIK